MGSIKVEYSASEGNSKDRIKKIVLTACIIVPALLSVIIYSGVIHHEFVYDDGVLVLRNKDIRNLNAESIKKLFVQRNYTNFLPLRMLSYAVDYHFWQFNPVGYHITNIVFHCLNTILCFLLIYIAMMRAVNEPPDWKMAAGVAFVASIFFAVHPIHVESVTNISGRKEVLYSFFFLIGLISYIFHRVKGDGPKFRGWFIVTLLCMIASLLSKASAVAMPFVLVLFDFLFPDVARRSKAVNRIQEYFVFVFVLCITIGLNMLLSQKENIFSEPFGGGLASHLLTIIKVVPFYLELVFRPDMLSIVYDVPVSFSLFEPVVLIAIVVDAVLVAGFFIAVKRNRIIAFAIGWFILTLGPTLNLVPFGIFAADRYMYLPFLGVCIAAGALYAYAMKRRAAMACAIVLLVVMVSACIYVTVDRNRDWRNEIALWESTIETAPNVSMVNVGLGIAYLHKDRMEEAVEYLEEGRRLDPKNAKAYVGLGQYYLKKMDFIKAYEVLKEGLKASNNDIEIYYYIAMTYFNLGQYKSAAQIFSDISKTRPGYMRTDEFLFMTLKKLSETIPFDEYDEFIEKL
ncbi:MAG TPA: tetratricopeptide repeat protein [bacterium]|nr:tetratricopeptide repeat protein [bacterium]